MKAELNVTYTYRMNMWLNVAALSGISAILIIAFWYQLVFSELPCPLCLLQRAGMMLIGFGFLFNICIGIKNIHYSIALFGCVLTGLIATRQVFLHILPGDPGYGSTFLGLHFYTWALVASVVITVAVAAIMTLNISDLAPPPALKSFAVKIVIALFILLIAANLISTILECGSGQCADDPVFYQLLKP